MAATIRATRVEAGLSQRDLALRTHTTQSAIARIESGRVAPTVTTVERLLAATGHALAVVPAGRTGDVDESQIAERLALTPAERLRTFTASQRRLSGLQARARRVSR